MRASLPLFDGVDELALAGVTRALAEGRAPGWTVETVATDAIVSTAGGLRVVPTALGWGRLRDADVLVVIGGPGVPERAARDPELVAALRRHLAEPRADRFLASVGSGALVLARAGLLEGRRATGARVDREALAKAALDVPPGARVVQDGRVITAAGSAAGVELGLYLLARLTTADAATRAGEALEVRGWAPP